MRKDLNIDSSKSESDHSTWDLEAQTQLCAKRRQVVVHEGLFTSEDETSETDSVASMIKFEPTYPNNFEHEGLFTSEDETSETDSCASMLEFEPAYQDGVDDIRVPVPWLERSCTSSQLPSLTREESPSKISRTESFTLIDYPYPDEEKLT